MVDDFALDERTGTIDACPAGHRPTSCARDTTTATTRVEMPASACAACPFRKRCPIKNTRDGKFTLEFTDKERRLAGRRVEEETDVFAARSCAAFGDRVDAQRPEEPPGPGEPAGTRSEERVAGASARTGGLERAAGGGVGEVEDLGGLPGGRNTRDERSRAIRRPFRSLGGPCGPRRARVLARGAAGPTFRAHAGGVNESRDTAQVEFCR